MEKTLATIRRELEAGFRHTFVLTQNVRDVVWDPSGKTYNFPSALSRELSKSTGQVDRLVARYSISQGIAMYRNGQILTEAEDPALTTFSRMTGLGDMLVLSKRSAADIQRQMMNPADVLPALYVFLRSPGSVNSLVIDSADYLLDCGQNGHGAQFGDRVVLEMLQSWARDVEIRSRGACIVLLCPELGAVPGDLIRGDGGFRVIRVGYPDLDERCSFLLGRGATEEQSARLGNLTTGFRRIDIEEVWRRGLSEHEVAKKKAEVIEARCGDVLEFIESKEGLDTAGAQPHVKQYLVDLKGIILRDRKSPLIPNGLLFVGVPGNGKSHITRAFAHDCGMNMLRFKNLRSMWVGESERNLETVLDLLPSFAPSVVFIDEVDQMLSCRSASGAGYGSEVDSRLLGRLLEFMGDSGHRGDILWIGATNRPDLIDAAMLRRFDRIFPFMNPTDEARATLIEDLYTRLKIPREPFDLAEAAALTREFSCDEVEKVVRRSYEICLRSGERNVALAHLRAARQAYKHNCNPAMHELIALLSVQASNFRSDLPWFDEQGRLLSRERLPEFMIGLVDEQGNLDERLIAQRIDQLRQAAAR